MGVKTRAFWFAAVSLLLLFLSLGRTLHAQDSAAWGRTLVVIPFENSSSIPGAEWLSEGIAEGLRWQLDSPVLYVATRDERLLAYDRLGIPYGVHPSRATLFRLAEQMDVDYAVIGSYRLDGQDLSATVQILDMRAPKLSASVTETAKLSELAGVEAAMAWDLVRLIRPSFLVPKEKYVAAAPAIAAEAQENYMHGILATNPQERVDYFRQAVRINPAFAEAWLALGKSYFEHKSYAPAIAALENIPSSAPQAREAHFYLGLSSCGQGDWAKAEAAFQFIAGQLPLAEVYNNLGVVAAHRGEKQAVADFEKAVENDPSDADFHFNLGVALARAGDKAGADRALHVALEGRPGDAEAKMLLDSLTDNSAVGTNGGATTKLPAERLKRNYQENAFRQMTTQIASWAEQRFARSEPRAHARYHIELGKELLAHGFLSEAETEFRHAAAVDPSNPATLVALAELYEARGDAREARAQAEASLRLHETVDAYLIVTHLDVQEGRMEAATRNLDRALQMEPNNRAALDLKRNLASKSVERGQP